MLGTSMASRDTFQYFITSSAVLEGMNCMLSHLWAIPVPAQSPLSAFWLALQLWPGQAAGCSHPAQHWDGAGAWQCVQGCIGQGSSTQAAREGLVCSAEMCVWSMYPPISNCSKLCCPDEAGLSVTGALCLPCCIAWLSSGVLNCIQLCNSCVWCVTAINWPFWSNSSVEGHQGAGEWEVLCLGPCLCLKESVFNNCMTFCASKLGPTSQLGHLVILQQEKNQ